MSLVKCPRCGRLVDETTMKAGVCGQCYPYAHGSSSITKCVRCGRTVSVVEVDRKGLCPQCKPYAY